MNFEYPTPSLSPTNTWMKKRNKKKQKKKKKKKKKNEVEAKGKEGKTEGCLTWCTKRFWTVRLLRIVITAADSRFCDLNLVDILARREEGRAKQNLGERKGRERERGRRKLSLSLSLSLSLGRKEKIGSWSIERTGIRLSVYTVERPDQEPWIIHRESETRCFGFGARTDVVPCLFALLVDSLSTLPLLVSAISDTLYQPACPPRVSTDPVQHCMYIESPLSFFLSFFFPSLFLPEESTW